jgi:hypothetical protein
MAQSIATTVSYHVSIIHPSKRPGQTTILGRVCLPRSFNYSSKTGHWTSLKGRHLEEKCILPFNLPTPLEFRVLAFGGVAPEK